MPVEDPCNLTNLDDRLAEYSKEQARKDSSKLEQKQAWPNALKVAVVGSGVAGLAAARYCLASNKLETLLTQVI
jgi:NADPH-dependent 2,4-dienoyl-CoA reductase/sulfur reductase-like enzyme